MNIKHYYVLLFTAYALGFNALSAHNGLHVEDKLNQLPVVQLQLTLLWFDQTKQDEANPRILFKKIELVVAPLCCSPHHGAGTYVNCLYQSIAP